MNNVKGQGLIIESLSDLDLDTLAYEDLSVKYYVWSDPYTNVGVVKLKVWRTAAASLIKREGEEHLYQWYLDWNEQWKGKAQKGRDYAAEVTLSRLWDKPEWVDFVAFNTLHRPEKLDDVVMFDIVSDCCKAAGLVTVQNITRMMGDERAPCPKCGRFTTFEYPYGF